jgi:hypothetical protein
VTVEGDAGENTKKKVTIPNCRQTIATGQRDAGINRKRKCFALPAMQNIRKDESRAQATGQDGTEIGVGKIESFR